MEAFLKDQVVYKVLFVPGAFQFRSELQSVRLYQSTGGLHIFVMASEAIYFLFIIYYMFVQVHTHYTLRLTQDQIHCPKGKFVSDSSVSSH